MAVFYIVLGGRLELPSLAALVPKTSAYTNSAIPASFVSKTGIMSSQVFSSSPLGKSRDPGSAFFLLKKLCLRLGQVHKKVKKFTFLVLSALQGSNLRPYP